MYSTSSGLDGYANPPAGGRRSRRSSDLAILAGTPPLPRPAFLIVVADAAALRAYRMLRHDEFVVRQQLFSRSDHDDVDDDPRTTVLVAQAPDGTILGGVRVAPVTAVDIGWWAGSRLVVADSSHAGGVGSALVRAACAHIESAGVLRFEAVIQDRYRGLFTGIGWHDRGPSTPIAGRAHRRMSWPLNQIQRTADTTKSILAEVLAPLAAQTNGLGPLGFRGDDGVPVPGADLVVACDAIIPSMVERDPRWAGWCSVLVNLNDLAAMGAQPIGLLDAVGAPTTAHLSQIIEGMAAAARAWDCPVLGGHTQSGVTSALAVTALGRTTDPIPAGGGRVGDTVSLLADLGGSWRLGYQDHQWDSTSGRSGEELRAMGSLVSAVRPTAAKDVSMAGMVGTLGMLAEASGTGAELDVADVPRPEQASMGAWLRCFPGYAMLVADSQPVELTGDRVPVTAAGCGRLTAAPGVRLRWPDGEVTTAITSTVTGLGVA